MDIHLHLETKRLSEIASGTFDSGLAIYFRMQVKKTEEDELCSLTSYRSFAHCYRQTTFETNLDFPMPGTKLKICMIMYI